MKIRKYVVLCSVLVALVVVWLAVEKSPNQTNSTEPTLEDTIIDIPQPPISVEKDGFASVIDDVTSSAPFRTMETIEDYVRKQELATREWRTPIDFYGKVVDENGNPVEGASPSSSVRWIERIFSVMT